MLRTSIGFIGIMINRADAHALANFLEAHYQRKPPDILLIEWVHGDWPGRGVIENKHSTDVESPPPPPRVCMSIHPEGKSCSDLDSSAGSQ